MIIDLQSTDVEKNITADICIVGAGPAGISLALELTKANPALSVCLLESGGAGYELDTQNLYIGENAGRDYFPLHITRLRQLGGTTGHWAGWCAPLNEIDFAKRDWVEQSGWPIEFDELSTYYAQANELLELGPPLYDSFDMNEMFPELSLLDDASVVSRLWQFSKPPLRFGSSFKSALESSQSIDVYLHANVVDIALVDNFDSIKSVDVSTLDKTKTFTVTCDTYVLACGGIENARILLNSNNQIPEGIGNSNDLVGRYFMEHIEAECATIHDADLRFFTKFKQFRIDGGLMGGGTFCPSDSLQKEKKIGNCGAYFRAQPMTSGPSGWSALLATVNQLKRGKIPENLVGKMRSAVADIDLIISVIALSVLKKPMKPITRADGTVEVISIAEQVPNRNSRVRLSNERDILGKQKAVMDWNLSRQDYDTVRETMLAVAAELARTGNGRMQLYDWLADDAGVWSDDARGGHHHMGTTRMADSATHGVVDRDCKVFGLDNFYVAGSSVFPTGGYANPTLSIVAMALRLSGLLASKGKG